jgi:cytochrome c-type biogenesis protein CcmE
VIALSVAAALAVFVIYTAVAGAGVPQIQPSELAQHHGQVLLVGKVVNSRGDAHSTGGLHFTLRDVSGTKPTRADVVYHGTVPDLFHAGREVVVTGALQNGTFVAQQNSLSTKCPSKYAPAKKTA